MYSKCEGNTLALNNGLRETVDAAGWALLFIWIGVVPIAHLSSAISLLGIGAIIVGIQVVQRILGRKWEVFRVAIGFLFAAAGIWKSFSIHLDLFPILCVAVGIAGLIAIATRRLRYAKKNTHPEAW